MRMEFKDDGNEAEDKMGVGKDVGFYVGG